MSKKSWPNFYSNPLYERVKTSWTDSIKIREVKDVIHIFKLMKKNHVRRPFPNLNLIFNCFSIFHTHTLFLSLLSVCVSVFNYNYTHYVGSYNRAFSFFLSLSLSHTHTHYLALSLVVCFYYYLTHYVMLWATARVSQLHLDINKERKKIVPQMCLHPDAQYITAQKLPWLQIRFLWIKQSVYQ